MTLDVANTSNLTELADLAFDAFGDVALLMNSRYRPKPRQAVGKP